MTLQAPYIGCKISIVSKLDIRYEGILYAVDSEKSTIALAKVRCFGTEDRPSPNPVSGRDDIFEYIVFKANDIKDLVVSEAPKPMIQFGNGLPYDPAIVQLSSDINKQPNKPSPLINNIIDRYNRGNGNSPQVLFPSADRGSKSMNRSSRMNHGNYQFNRSYQMNGIVSNRTKGQRERSKRIDLTANNFDMKKDYDFDAANQHFENFIHNNRNRIVDGNIGNKSNKGVKKSEMDENNENELDKGDEKSAKESEQKTTFYDKSSSFFDKISYRIVDNQQRGTSQRNWNKELLRNQRTFGDEALRLYASYPRNNAQGYYTIDRGMKRLPVFN